MRKTLINLLVGGVAFAGVIGLQMQRQTWLVTQQQNNLPLWRQQEVQTRTQLRLWRELPGFGWNNLIADWWLIQFNLYFGDDEARTALGYGLVPDFFEVILQRDPRFIRAYLFLSVSGSLYAAEPERSIQIASRAMRFLTPDVPGSYYPWMYRGIDEMLFLGDGRAARRSFQTAAAWASQWDTPDSQVVVKRASASAELLRKNPDSRAAKVIGWASILEYATTPRVQALAIRKILEAGGQIRQTPDGQRYIVLPRDVQEHLR
ncbi:MAG: hypothetical protein RMI89_10305 [Gloeomargarita sp. SKYBB_i_bin120]|nr:hypothetical protein [Gloeomargarita sp. SKYG98]MCS7293342.1 hypothetical protein [Gloeomargarita sp. SKYB120]MDW8178907.1 hypothetical protein [Gloeomargarita sp. SKYBB_i_bin120]